ncbi:hypothetical protein ACRAWF_21215 [Streptomyces sp. L7]
MDSVLAHLKERRRAGRHRPHAGGAADTEGDHAYGCFRAADRARRMSPPRTAIWREEVFGPVLAVRAVDDFSAGRGRGERLRLRARRRRVHPRSRLGVPLRRRRRVRSDRGQRDHHPGWDVHLPFGGFHDSGTGCKEQGDEVLRFSTRVRAPSPSSIGA